MLNVNAKKWVEALRSGEYEQGTGQLHKYGKFCALGVLVDLFIKDTGLGYWLGEDLEPVGLACTGYIPKPVVGWANLVDDENCLYCITRENDLRKSFMVIADIIESEPEGLFK